MPTNNDYLSDIANVPRDTGLTNNQLLEQIADNGGSGGGGSKDKTYEVAAQSVNYDIPADATTVIYLDGQDGGITLPDPTVNRSINLLYLYSEPTTLYGSLIPEIEVKPYTCYEVIAYYSSTDVLAWVAVECGQVPTS